MIDSIMAMLPEFIPGLGISLLVTIASLVLGLPLGILLALGSLFAARPLKFSCIGLIELGRGIPGLIMLYLVYFGLPQMGLVMDALPASMIALGLMTGAYTAEIFVAGFRAVPQGQWEACGTLALSYWKSLRLVILPQAIKIVVPPLIGWTIMLFQATSLAYAISVPELMSRAYNFASVTFEYALAFTLAGFMYLAVTLLGLWLFRKAGGRRRSTSMAKAAAPAAV
jgi:polar amino acid transport system permease protein